MSLKKQSVLGLFDLPEHFRPNGMAMSIRLDSYLVNQPIRKLVVFNKKKIDAKQYIEIKVHTVNTRTNVNKTILYLGLN